MAVVRKICDQLSRNFVDCSEKAVESLHQLGMREKVSSRLQGLTVGLKSSLPRCKVVAIGFLTCVRILSVATCL